MRIEKSAGSLQTGWCLGRVVTTRLASVLADSSRPADPAPGDDMIARFAPSDPGVTRTSAAWRASDGRLIRRFAVSAVPALEQGGARGAQWHDATGWASGEPARLRGVGRGWARGRPRARTGGGEGQPVEEPPAAIGADHGRSGPVRLRPIAQTSVQGGAGARAMPTVIIPRLTGARLDERDKPVPVQHRHVVVGIGPGMPAQEMVVIGADLAGRVVVADIVIVGLRQRDVDRAEDQNSDPQGSQAAPL
jgi:hypothetical protein